MMEARDKVPSSAEAAEAFAGWFNQGIYETVSREAGEIAHHNRLNRDLRAALAADALRQEAGEELHTAALQVDGAAPAGELLVPTLGAYHRMPGRALANLRAALARCREVGL